ncbi:MAG: glutaminase [Panacagrimonas sp.]
MSGAAASADYAAILEEIHAEIEPFLGRGRVADYIPALARVPPRQFGMALTTIDGREYTVGDAHVPFSVQSIAKVSAVALALRAAGDTLWSRVGREPSGNPFNSLVQLESENGIPRNPFINAGALVTLDVLMEHVDDPIAAMLSFARGAARNPAIDVDTEVAESELEHSERNRALAHFMKSFGNIRSDVDRLLSVYVRQCAIRMHCVDLCRSFLFLANQGVMPWSGMQVLSANQSKRLSALMLTCGFYDESGDFAFRVGLPGKSGVGGGVAAVLPGHFAIAVWSPELGRFGNSLAGIEALDRFTTRTGQSVF